jgi:hypothetical protein
MKLVQQTYEKLLTIQPNKILLSSLVNEKTVIKHPRDFDYELSAADYREFFKSPHGI